MSEKTKISIAKSLKGRYYRGARLSAFISKIPDKYTVKSSIYMCGIIILYLDKIYSVSITQAKTSQILILAI